MNHSSTSHSRRILSVLTILFAISFASRAKADAPLADHVPGDAVVYIGWAGADSQLAAYQASDLGAFINNSNLPEIARQYVPKLWDQLAGHSDDKEAVAALQKLLPLLWRHLVAVYVSNVTTGPDGAPDGSVAMICDAGPDAADLQTDLQALIKDNPHLHVSASGSLVTASVNLTADAAPGSTLAASPTFIKTMQRLQPSPACAVYVDGKTLLEKIDESAAKHNGAADIWPKVRDALGVAGLKTYAMTAGFDGGNWMTASVLEAPSPRTGLLAAIEPKPIDPALLARIPASASSVSVYNLDLVKLIDTIGDAMACSKESDQFFHQANGIATMVLGRPLRSQIIAPLDPQWVLYSDSKLHGLVLMNHPSDSATAGDSMVSATFGLVNLANSQIPGASKQPVVNAVQTTVKHVDVTSAVTKLASPSFAVKDGVLYFGLTPESVVSSATLPANPPSTDLLHSENFVAGVKRLGVPDFASFDYCDLPNTAPAAYDNFGKAGPQLRAVMSLFNVDIPKVELPPMEQLKLHLSPALSVSWADAEGVYSKSISPFPLSTELLGDPQQSMITVSAVSMGVAILLPALEKAREQANLVQSMSNQRQILQGLIMYSNSHQGAMPPDLGSVISDGELPGVSLKIFLLPGSDTEIPADILNGTKDQQAAWVNDHAEYEFLVANQSVFKQGQTATKVVLVPKGAEHMKRPVPVGFADGHVEACKPQRVHQLLHPDAQPDDGDK